jgi:hypothetical protein
VLLQSGAKYATIFDESPLATQCRRDLANALGNMINAGLYPTDAMRDAHRLLLVEFDKLFPSPAFQRNQAGASEK